MGPRAIRDQFHAYFKSFPKPLVQNIQIGSECHIIILETLAGAALGNIGPQYWSLGQCSTLFLMRSSKNQKQIG